MSLSLVLTAILAISAAVVILSSLESSVNAIIVNNTDFSVNVPDNWAYRETGNAFAGALAKAFGVNPPLTLIPTEFSNLLVNTSEDTLKAIQNRGLYSQMGPDPDYPYRNVPLGIRII